MVKADAKHDYYADLEVPATADQETIKKQFRLLAKQYHPDRNPGKETEVVAKFQAVQAAHEILSDVQQKAKYDTDRSKYLKKAAPPDPYTFKRAQTTKVPPPNPAFQPPPSKPRNTSVDRSQFVNPRTQPASTSAERFAAFTRAASQQWDKAKFEEAAAKAEALRNFQSMRGQPPPHPPRPARAPTAPKPGNTTPSQDYTHASGPSPGFPGLSRTQSIPRKHGFSPATPGSDEPPAKSAYAYVHSNRDRSWSYQNASSPPPTSASSGGYGPDQTEYPLKSSQSSSGFDNAQRPAFGRTPSRYATNSGEKTNINGSGLGRSASVRNSPIDKRFGEHGPFGARARSSQEFMQPPPRHHSASPKMKPPRAAGAEFSATETSSSEDEFTRRKPRPKAVPRQPKPPVNGRSTSNDPALMGQYPNKNYTRVVDDTQYVFPPPETRDAPYRKPFNEMPIPLGDITDGMKSTGLQDGHQEFPKPRSSNPNLGDHSEVSPGRNKHHKSSFSASDWDGKFGNGENIFAPNERDRKSPTKTSRTRPSAKPRGSPVEIDEDSDSNSPTQGAAWKSRPRTSPRRENASQNGTLSVDDWSERLKSQSATTDQHTLHQGRDPHVNSVQDDSNLKETGESSITDPMDIDTNGFEESKPVPFVHIESESRRGSGGGVNLSELAETFPFKPSADGLQSLPSDLAGTLPFKSRAADQVQLTAPSGAALRGMSLPKPPKPVLAPDDVTQDTWESYWKKMQQYMHDWSAFNIKMIDHFRLRQEQIDHNMYQNWVMGVGEGANAQDVDGSDFTSPPGSAGGENTSRKPKAGYHTYMQWLEQDALCRSWWSAAFEEHRECLDELGRMRRTVKAIRDRQDSQSAR